MIGLNRVGIDIDGTITTMDIIIDVFNRETGKELTLEDLKYYDVGKCYGIDKEESKRIWKNYTVEIVKRSIPIWNLQDFMYGWERYGITGKKRNEIIIVTARPEEYKEETILWLKNNKVDFDEIYFGYDKKIDAVGEYFLDIFIDDKADNIKDIEESEHIECEAFLVDQPYNRYYPAKNRIYTNKGFRGVV